MGPQSVYAGGPVSVGLSSDPGTAGAVGLYAAGGTAPLDWRGLDGTQNWPSTGAHLSSLAFTAPATPGNYEFRYRFNGTTVAQVTFAITLPPPPVLTVTGAQPILPAASIQAAISNDPRTAGWIGVYASGATTLLDWKWMNGTQNATLTGPRLSSVPFTAPRVPGNYEFRYKFNGVVSATVAFTVSAPPPPVLTLSVTTAAAGTPVAVNIARDPQTPGWIGLYIAGTETAVDWRGMDGTLAWPSTATRLSSIPFPAPATPGSYEFRYIFSGATLAGSGRFTVK